MAEEIYVKADFDKVDALFEELYKQCETADRLSDELCSELERLSEPELEHLDSQIKNGVTPLFIAAKRGIFDIVNYLLEKCGSNINQFCKSFIEREPQRTALMETPNVDVARCLLEHGAEYMSMALRVHICSSRFQVADYLISKGANLNDEPKNDEGKTCLDYVDDDPQKYELLLKYGANVNARKISEDTPLHTAVKNDKPWQVVKLLKYGADPKLKNCHGDDVLRLVCLYVNDDIFDYLMENVEYSSNTRANAYELFGAIYVHEKGLWFSPTLKENWRTALRIRQNGGQFLERELIEEPLIKELSEIRTEDDLNKLAISRSSIVFQTVLITHRILGYKHPVTDKVLSNFFEICIDDFEVENAFRIMMCINEIYVRSNGLIGEISHYASIIAIEMAIDISSHQKKYVKNNFEDVLTTAGILWSNLMNPKAGEDVHIAIVTLLYALLKRKDHIQMLKAFVTGMVQKKYCDRKGRSMLHLIASLKETQFELILCQRLPVIQLLLECGHDVDALDLSGSSPLHLEASGECDLDVVKCLLEHGAHIDRINIEGIRPCQLLDAVPGFKTFKYVTPE